MPDILSCPSVLVEFGEQSLDGFSLIPWKKLFNCANFCGVNVEVLESNFFDVVIL